jgi:POT family proton-dependent oligopeptide transporter
MDSTAAVDSPLAKRSAGDSDRAFLGHPTGLGFIAFTEAWERFSYYGMQAILVLYMVDQLLLPGHAEHVVGLAALRRGLEGVFGHLTTQGLSSQIFGLYTSLVYVTPLFGGIAGDRWLGRRMSVIIGALLMACGHFMMAFEASFLPALLAIILGSGFLKGNLACQVGELYVPGDVRRDQAFQIYLVAINAGSIAAPMVCGTLGEKVGYHYGFAAAGVGMVIGLFVYLSGRKRLPHDPPRLTKLADAAAPKQRMTAQDWRAVGAILALIPIFALVLVPNNQGFNVGVLWWRDYMNLNVFGFQMPVTWLLSIETVFSVSGLAYGVIVWRWLAARGIMPHELTKIIIGVGLAVFEPLIKASFSLAAASGGWKIPLPSILTWDIVSVAAFVCYYPTGLSLVSRAAPPRLAGVLISAYMMFTVGTNFLVGWVGSYYQQLGAPLFWLVHAGFPAASFLILLIAYRPLKQAFGDPARTVAEP